MILYDTCFTYMILYIHIMHLKMKRDDIDYLR